MTDPKLLRRLVERYYSNSATREELTVFVHLQKAGVLDEVLDEFLHEQILEEADGFNRSKSGFRAFSTKMKWAASVSILIVCIYLTFHFTEYFSAAKYVHVHTNQYEEKNLKLADGSLITLNRNSEFAYPVEWKGSSREVKLISGEAYFQIVKNKQHPSFIVHLPEGVDVKVLGTRFNIKKLAAEAGIYLESGAVRVTGGGYESDLKPGQLARCSNGGQKIDISEVNGEAWLAWKNDMFFFDDTRLSDVGKVLEDYYHQKVIIERSEVAALRFTGKIPRNDLTMLLRILAGTLDIEIVHHNNRITMEDKEGIFPKAD